MNEEMNDHRPKCKTVKDFIRHDQLTSCCAAKLGENSVLVISQLRNQSDNFQFPEQFEKSLQGNKKAGRAEMTMDGAVEMVRRQ